MISFNKRTRRWELGPLPAEKLADLEVPGLDVAPKLGSASGYPDAVAAAAMRLGIPERPPIPKANPKLVLPDVDLRNYQVEGIGRMHAVLTQYGGGLLADDMGLGKTRQAAVLAHILGGRKLIVCPAAVRETWRKELKGIGVPDTEVSILGPPSLGKKYRADWERMATVQWVVTSYELHERAIEAGFKGVRFPRVLIIDEMHGVKGRKSQRGTALEQLARMVMFRLGLTGTPLWDRPRDMYQQLKVLHGQKLWGSAYLFDHTYCAGHHDEHGGWKNKGISNSQELKERLGYYMLRREKTEVAKELPLVTRQVMWLDPTDTASRALTAFAFKSISITEALRATLREKRAEAIRLAAEARKFLLCTWLIEEAELMWAELNKQGVPCNLITGKVETGLRNKLILDAKAEGKGIVATTDSIGVGVDGLQHVASTGIFHALDHVPMKMRQTEDRLNRLGQTAPVIWYYLAMRNTADELVMKNILDKLGAVSNVMADSSANALRSALTVDAERSAEEDLRKLYEEMTSEPEET